MIAVIGVQRRALRLAWAAARMVLVLTLLLGLAYPLALTGIAQSLMPHQAGGSIVTVRGHPVGSALIGQNFTDASGAPLRQYFQSRPSAAGRNGYDGAASGASNLGPTSPTLLAAVRERRAQIAAFNDVPVSAVPADAVTASGSGLDPDISVAYALIQVDRIAAARHATPDAVRAILARHTSGRALGFLGEPAVNVLAVNLALDASLPIPGR